MKPRRVGFNCDDEFEGDPSLLNTVNVTLREEESKTAIAKFKRKKMPRCLFPEEQCRCSGKCKNKSPAAIEPELRGICIQKVNKDGTVEVSVDEYKKIKRLLVNLIKNLDITNPSLTDEMLEWYKKELMWDEVWRFLDVKKKLTDEEYALLEKHILEQKDEPGGD